MNAWYYSQADQAVGPFQVEVLGKLAQAGIIDDATPVRQTEETEWRPLSVALAEHSPSSLPPVQQEARYYYLDSADQPIGPFDLATIQRLHAEQVIGASTLASGVGDPEWIPAARLLKLPVIGSPQPPTPALSATDNDVHPRFRAFADYVRLSAVTLGFYPLYLVPCHSHDMKAITGRERMEFTALLILGVVTVGLLTLVMQVLYAFDLERHGKTVSKAGRQEALGVIVLVTNALAVILSIALDGIAGFVVGAVLGSSALWFVQKEINLYAAASVAATV